MTKKQIWARKRNWLIMRLLGAKSIFAHDNIVFMYDIEERDRYYVDDCKDALDDLIETLRKSTYKEK